MDSNSILTVVNRAGGHSCGLHCRLKAASGEAAVVGAQGEAKLVFDSIQPQTIVV